MEIREGKASVLAPSEKKISKKLPVFYNPVMKLNRDISVHLINSAGKKDMQIALPMAGTGIRGIRFILELGKGIAKSISLNDMSPNAAKLIKKNIKRNSSSKNSEIIVSSEDANLFLLKSTGFDYIDIDPFGTPNPFLDSAVKRISRGGILAVTATDTSALAGSYPDACRRKYWASPLRNHMKHESGIRILIRKIQLVGAQYEKALVPVYSYSDQHYVRVFLICKKGKSEADSMISQHSEHDGAGPMWKGTLWDKKLAKKIAKASKIKIAETIAEEADEGSFGFYCIHSICSRLKLNAIPKKEHIIRMIKDKGFSAANTHFLDTGIRSNIGKDKIEGIIRKLSKEK